MELIKGKPVADSLKEEIIAAAESMEIKPRLAIVRVGEKPADVYYEGTATKRLTSLGLRVSSHAFDENISFEEFRAEFEKINSDADVSGILVMRPFPKHLKDAEKWIETAIDPAKDVDCISPVNIAGVMTGDESAFAPCTAQSVMEILKFYNIDPCGKNVVIIGRSMVVGKPLSMMMLKANATVTVCHTKTTNLSEVTKQADILVVAAGKAGLVNKDFVKDGAVLIDVGTNVNEEGKLCGDCDLSGMEDMNVTATPVPGGVGSVTTTVLAKHLVLK